MKKNVEGWKSCFSATRMAWMIIVAVLVIDQLIKIAVKTNMYLYERIRITDWFYILFTENAGMAFGWEFGDKIFLTAFRIVAVVGLAYWMRIMIRKGLPKGFIACMSLIVAGAAGNIIDCLFYGLIFNNPPPPFVADFVPFGTGYGEMFYGKVVDMFYFPIIRSQWPEWMPFCGGERFVFFSPIFNFADACISVGVVLAIVCYPKIIAQETSNEE